MFWEKCAAQVGPPQKRTASSLQYKKRSVFLVEQLNLLTIYLINMMYTVFIAVKSLHYINLKLEKIACMPMSVHSAHTPSHMMRLLHGRLKWMRTNACECILYVAEWMNAIASMFSQFGRLVHRGSVKLFNIWYSHPLNISFFFGTIISHC